MNAGTFRFSGAAFLALAMALAASPVCAQKKYDPGATDTEIKIGNLMAYTGPFAEYGATGRAEAAYFQMINDRGGVNGRKINFVSVDNGTNFRGSLDLARKLVEEDKVLLLFGNFGYATNLAIRGYLNENKIPQLFLATNDSTFDDPAHFPWTMGFGASKRIEGIVYAKYILQNKPEAKIAVLYPSDESGQDWLEGIHEGLGEKSSKLIVKEVSFSYIDPAGLDSRIAELKDSGADVFLNMSVGKYATLAIRKAYDMGWRPLEFLPNASLSIAAFLEPAGLEKAVGIMTNARSKGWASPESQSDPAVREYVDWMKKYNRSGNLRDANNLFGYEVSETLVEVLKKCGDNLTRQNVMDQAASLNLELGMLLPGIRVTTSKTDYQPIKQLYLIRFNGKSWDPIGGVIGE